MQQMDNVALSCLLAMANVEVSYCRDGLCRSGLWARCILTHSHRECITTILFCTVQQLMEYQLQEAGFESYEMEILKDSQIVSQNSDSNESHEQVAELQGELLEPPFEKWCEGELPEKAIKTLIETIIGSPRFGPTWAAPVIAGVFGVILLTGTLGNVASAAVTV